MTKAKRLEEIGKHGFSVPEFCIVGDDREIPFGFVRGDQIYIARSSFDIEDGADTAFAGCFHSEVVHPGEDINAALGRVFASLESESATEQILAAGVNPKQCTKAAIVQVFIKGQISGVAFSHQPDGTRQGFCEWVFGGCASLTNGETCESARFNERPPVELKPFWRELVRGVKRLESLYGRPIDAEWTFDGKTLWWLQARPITGEGATRACKSKDGAKWSRDNVAERFPTVMTPMGWSLIEEILEHSLTSLVRYTGIRCKNVQNASLFEKGLVFGNESYFRCPNCSLTLKALAKLSWSSLLATFKSGVPKRGWRARFSHHAFLSRSTRAVLKEWNEELESHLTKIRAFDPHVRGIYDARSKIDELRTLSFSFFKTDLAIHLLKELNVHLVAGALNIDQSDVAQFEGNETLLMHQGLRSLCDALEKDDGAHHFLERLTTNDPNATRCLSEKSQEAYRDFVNLCGHMSEGWDVTSTCLRENAPAIVALIRQTTLRRDKEREPARNDKVVGHSCSDLVEMFANAKALCAADEQQHFYAGLYLEKSRQVLASIAEHLINIDVISRPDDIYYLSANELDRYLKRPDFTLKPLVRRRRRIWERYENPIQQLNPVSSLRGPELKGIGTSAGVATGVPFFVESFSHLKDLPDNAVLCLKAPNPSFVPWFDRCNAIITENGGVLSHGFIAARELQIPAVSGISFTDLKEMNHVIVDGSTGTVKERDLRRHAC